MVFTMRKASAKTPSTGPKTKNWKKIDSDQDSLATSPFQGDTKLQLLFLFTDKTGQDLRENCLSLWQLRYYCLPFYRWSNWAPRSDLPNIPPPKVNSWTRMQVVYFLKPLPIPHSRSLTRCSGIINSSLSVRNWGETGIPRILLPQTHQPHHFTASQKLLYFSMVGFQPPPVDILPPFENG